MAPQAFQKKHRFAQPHSPQCSLERTHCGLRAPDVAPQACPPPRPPDSSLKNHTAHCVVLSARTAASRTAGVAPQALKKHRFAQPHSPQCGLERTHCCFRAPDFAPQACPPPRPPDKDLHNHKAHNVFLSDALPHHEHSTWRPKRSKKHRFAHPHSPQCGFELTHCCQLGARKSLLVARASSDERFAKKNEAHQGFHCSCKQDISISLHEGHSRL